MFQHATIQTNPELTALVKPGETVHDFARLPTETILIRWVNFQLNKAVPGLVHLNITKIKNFTDDIKDCVAYTHLLKQIAPKGSGVDTSALKEPNLLEKAQITLNQAAKIGCKEFVTASDIVDGNDFLNLAFVANLFRKYPSLETEKPTEELEQCEFTEETREEKSKLMFSFQIIFLKCLLNCISIKICFLPQSFPQFQAHFLSAHFNSNFLLKVS